MTDAKTYRYRRLSSRRDGRAVDALYREGRGPAWLASPSRRLGARLVAEAEAPKEVRAEEGQASFEVLAELLRRGGLELTDLVESSAGWRAFAEAPEFFEACEQRVLRRERTQKLKKWALVAGAVLAYFGLFYGVMAHDHAQKRRQQEAQRAIDERVQHFLRGLAAEQE